MITRAQWKARPPKSTPTRVAITSRTGTAIHYDGGTPISVSTFEQAAALMRRDQNYHMDRQGWSDIGYNYLIASAPGFPEIDGLVFEGRGRDVVGAHCAGHNTEWIGVQIAIGGDQRPSPKALASARALHDSCQRAAGHALAMKGHRDGFPTLCPGPVLYAWVRAGMPTTTAPPVPSKSAPTKPAEPQTPPSTPKPRPTPSGAITVKPIDLRNAAATAVTGAGVKPMQRLLGVDADGFAGTKTRTALIAAQKRAGLAVDAVFGTTTATALLAGK